MKWVRFGKIFLFSVVVANANPGGEKKKGEQKIYQDYPQDKFSKIEKLYKMDTRFERKSQWLSTERKGCVFGLLGFPVL